MNTERFGQIAMSPDITAVILGCGGLGGYTTGLLARMGISKFVLIDHDVVTEPNLGTQVYEASDVGLPKVTALRNRLVAMGLHPSSVQAVSKKIDTTEDLAALLQDNPNYYLFGLTDNISSRKCLAEYYLHHPCERFIDARCGGLDFEVNLFISREELQSFMPTYEDTNFAEAPCGLRSAPHANNMAACLVIAAAIHNGPGHTLAGNVSFNPKLTIGKYK